MAQDTKPEDYYPLRWKVADAVEDVFVLHRSKAIGVIALIGLAFILFGFLLLGWGGARNQTDTASTQQTDAPTTSPSTTPPTTTPTTDAPTTAAPTTDAPTTDAPVTTAPTTTAPASDRAAASAEELANTTAGAIAELTPTAIRLTGGLASSDAADEIVQLVEASFDGVTVADELVVDNSFADGDEITFRLSAPDLFGYNSDNLNPNYFPLIDQLAAAIVEAETWRVEVSGHTDDSGPAEGNQRLSDRRAAAAAQRLIAQGVSTGQLTSIGRGEDQPIADNGSEAGRLANRRVEFAITR